MSNDAYMADAGWSRLVPGRVLDRSVQVFERRLHTVGDVIRASVGRDGDDFLVQGERRLTFGDFRRAVEVGAAALREVGIGVGDRVMIVLYNSPEFWLAQCAIWRLGAVPVLGNRWWSPVELDDALARIMPAAIVTDSAVGAAHRVLTPAEVRVWWDLPAPDVFASGSDAAIDEDDVAVMVFTAGSTGQPKCVELTHRVLVWTQQTIQVMRGGKPPVAPASSAAQKVALMTTPLFHNGGMVAMLGLHVDGGRAIFPLGKFDPSEVMALIERERVTSWSAVPTMFSRLLRSPALGDHDLSSLSTPASGGAAVTPAFVADLAERLPIAARGFSSGYGMTEMSFLTMVGAGDIASRPGTVGRLVPGVELRVDRPDADGTGELLARSAALMARYAGETLQPIDAEGWYATGDVGRVDDDGFVYLTGRSKDMVIRGGENIACQHVEAALLSHPDVVEAAVIGVPDDEFGEAVAAIVHCQPGAVPNSAALAAHARSRLAYFQVPTHWHFRDTPLPVLPTGKVDKPALRQALAPHSKTPSSIEG